MNILVTGGAGFVGTNLIKKLLNDNHNIISIDNYTTGFTKNHQIGAEYISDDIINLDHYYSKLKNIQLCYHLAALPRIQPSFNKPTDTFVSNTYGTQIIAEWARINNVKLVYSGSSSRWHDPYQSPYALYKHLGEEILKMYKCVYDCNFEIVRFYNVYGPYEILDGDWAAVIGLWRNQVKNHKSITIIGDGEQRRDFTHVIDIVDGLVKIGLSDKKHSDAWELGTGKNYSINEVYKMFKYKFNIGCEYLPDQKGNYRSTIRKNEDAINMLGWKPQDRLREYINSL